MSSLNSLRIGVQLMLIIIQFSVGYLINSHSPYLENVQPWRSDLFDVEFPEKNRLKMLDRVPRYPQGIKPPKMQKMLRLLRGPELIHNTFLHKQYGIVALGGGRLKISHLEVIRLALGRELDQNRMFAVWRVDSPWQPITRKTQGQRMGGGKGHIDHYVTPVKAGRVLVEVGGRCEYGEVRRILSRIAQKMPFRAKAFSYDELNKYYDDIARMERDNRNPFTFEYMIKNNMAGCCRWISKYDFKWLGKYM